MKSGPRDVLSLSAFQKSVALLLWAEPWFAPELGSGQLLARCWERRVRTAVVAVYCQAAPAQTLSGRWTVLQQRCSSSSPKVLATGASTGE